MDERPFEIVIAEDNAADVVLIREALAAHSISCATQLVQDGEQALTLIRKFDTDPSNPPFDLLILDMHLPRYDGEEVLKKLRSTAHYSDTPVIVMAGFSTAAIDAAAGNVPISYFSKPTDFREFLKLGALVRKVLETPAGGNVPEIKESNDTDGSSAA